MAGPIRVSTTQLQTISGKLQSAESEITSLLNNLKNVVAPLQQDWTGTAGAQFEQYWSQWQQDAQGAMQALQGISQLTAKAAQLYATTDQSIAQGFS